MSKVDSKSTSSLSSKVEELTLKKSAAGEDSFTPVLSFRVEGLGFSVFGFSVRV